MNLVGTLFNPVNTLLTEIATTVKEQSENKKTYLDIEPKVAKVKDSIKYFISQGSQRKAELL